MDNGDAFGPGCQPSASAADASSQSGIPIAGMANFDETDWHALAQDISNYWIGPEERAVAYQAAAEAIKLLRLEMGRRDRNELRNCLNWGPCTRHDGRMSDASVYASAMSGSAQDRNGLGPKGASAVPQADAPTPSGDPSCPR